MEVIGADEVMSVPQNQKSLDDCVIVLILLRVTWVASLFRGSLLDNTFVNMQQHCRRC
jgi:hypothetical protein